MEGKWEGYGNTVTVKAEHGCTYGVVTVNGQIYVFDSSNSEEPIEHAKAFFTGICNMLREKYNESIDKGPPTVF